MNLFENMNTVDRSAESKGLIAKWTKSGLLEGLKDATERSTMAVLLENQAKQLIKEGSATTSGTGTSGFEQWTGVALPLIRRVFAEIAAKEFVSVQPMNLPSGLVFYLDFKYGTNKAPFGFDPTGKNQTGTVQGITSQSGAPSDGLYGAGRFGYSNNFTSSVAASATTGSAGTNPMTDTIVNFDSNFTGSLANYKTFTIALPSDADTNAIRAFQPYSGSTALTANTQYFPAFTSVVGSNLQFVVTSSILVGATGPTLTNSKVSYIVQPTNDVRGDFEAKPVSATNRSVDTDLSIPEIELQMRSVPVTAKTRKLKAAWSPEFAQDLNAYHSVDAEAELTAMLSEYVSMEVDLEILDMLIKAAATTEYWSATNNNFYNASTGNFAVQGVATGGYYNTQGGWFQTLGTKMQKISAAIHAKTLRGGANFAVVSPDISVILESIPGYATEGDGEKMKYAMGVMKAGTMTGRYQIYKNPYMQENTVLMGFRGNQFLETGAVYAPYIPLMLTPLVYDPNNFTPRRGVMTRYAKLVTRPEFYGKIYVQGLNGQY